MSSRRQFLKHAGLISTAPLVPHFLNPSAARATDNAENDGHILVVIQLNGGNDGLNTIVPYTQDVYREKRPAIALPEKQLLKINDEVAFNGSMNAAHELLQDGRLAIVQNVGYPNPDRSHFRSMAIWHTASNAEELPQNGWAGRALDGITTGSTDAVFFGDADVPRSLHGRRLSVSSMLPGKKLKLQTAINPQNVLPSTQAETTLDAFVQRNVVDAYETVRQLNAPQKQSAVAYPASQLATSLRSVAQFIGIESPARVYYTTQSGYDTHDSQLANHGALLSDFSGSLKAFLDDLKAMKLDDRVTVMAFSEFGRRVSENGSAGTDHGTAGPVFIAGRKVANGLIGSTPDLSDLDGDDLKVDIDFRRVYATVLQEKLGIPPAPVLGGEFKTLPLFA